MTTTGTATIPDSVKEYRKTATIMAMPVTWETLEEAASWIGADIIVDRNRVLPRRVVVEGSTLDPDGVKFSIDTLEGPVTGRIGEYHVVKNETGEFYLIDDGILAKTYVAVV